MEEICTKSVLALGGHPYIILLGFFKSDLFEINTFRMFKLGNQKGFKCLEIFIGKEGMIKFGLFFQDNDFK